MKHQQNIYLIMYLQRITSKQILITKLDIELMRLSNIVNHYLVCNAASSVQC